MSTAELVKMDDIRKARTKELETALVEYIEVCTESPLEDIANILYSAVSAAHKTAMANRQWGRVNELGAMYPYLAEWYRVVIEE